MRMQIEVITESQEEIQKILEFVEEQEICTVEILQHDNRVTLCSYWQTYLKIEDVEELAYNNRKWRLFVQAFTQQCF